MSDGTQFLLQPESIRVIALVVLNTTITIYLVRSRSRQGATHWLAGFTGGMAAFYLIRFAQSIIYPFTGATPFEMVLNALEALVVPPAMGALVQFAYRFRGNPFPRGARRALWITASVTAAFVAMIFGSVWFVGLAIAWPLAYSLVWLVFSLWAARVFMRKRRRILADSDTNNTQDDILRQARGYATFAILCALFVAILIVILIAIFVGAEALWAGVIVGVYAFFFGLVAAYVNHAPSPSSFQVKLVGISLALVLAIFGITALSLFHPWDVVNTGRFLPGDRDDLVFRLDDHGGYEVTNESVGMASTWGDSVSFDSYAKARLGLGFSFPFAGSRWDTVTVSTTGVAVLGADRSRSFGYMPYDEPVYSVIAPLFVTSFPARTLGGSRAGLVKAFFSAGVDGATITWLFPEVDRGQSRLLVQLALREDGTFSMAYGRSPVGNNPTSFRDIPPGLIRGILIAESTGSIESSLRPDTSLRIPRNVSVVHDLSLEFGKYLHAESARILILMLIAVAFVLFAYPLSFRRSVVAPIRRLQEGMRRVNAGNLGTVIPVGVRDEFGLLTEDFNQTTHSLKEADNKVKDYAATLEQRVADRTAELNQSLENLRAAQQQLVHSEKMASLGTLTAGIAHEIKNPLNFVNNFASLSLELIDEADLPACSDDLRDLVSSLRMNAEKIEEHGKRADSIVRSMMQHARGGTGQRERVDLNDLVSEYLDLAWHGERAKSTGFDVELAKDLDSTVGIIEVVPQEIGRVLLNLLGNAFDAVSDQTAAADGDYHPRVEVSTERAGAEVVIRVRDNGPGIPDDVAPRIFEPFFTTKPTGSGTGLGLSLSYDIVAQAHNGRMTAENSDDGGAIFTVALPAR